MSKETGFTIALYRHPEQLPESVAQLFNLQMERFVEFGLDWYRNLVDNVFSAPASAYFYVLYAAGVPLAVLPLSIVGKGRGHTASSLTNYYSSLYEPVFAPALDAAALAQLLRHIAKQHAGLEEFRFAPLSIEHPSFDLLRQGLRLAGFPVFTEFCFGNWYLEVRSSWPEYLKSRNGTMRSLMKSKKKKFLADGGETEIFQSGDGLERVIDEYTAVYNASWKKPEPYPGFIPGLMRMCARNGWLRVALARINGTTIAAQIWIVANGRANIYKLAYREGFGEYSSGTLLTAQLMEHVLEVDRVSEVDFLTGDDKYKKEWMSHRRERFGLVGYNPFTLGGARSLAKQYLKALVARVAGLARARQLPAA